jgi:lysophospholipid acyltransferase (LPLAT)-like uncharacterized protein
MSASAKLSAWFEDTIKKARNSDHFDWVASKIMAFFMRLAFFTTRWTIVGEGIPDEYHKSGRPFIVCLWHDRLMLAPCVWKWKKPLHVLASNHRDGKLIARVVKNFSMPAIFGSTGKGVSAAKKLVKLARSGKYIAIIPDGPRGPRHKLAPGVVAISKLANVDVLPFSFCVKRYHRLHSWDRFICVWPFNRGAMVWGKAITPDILRGMNEAEAVAYVESKINEASEKALRILTNG